MLPDICTLLTCYIHKRTLHVHMHPYIGTFQHPFDATNQGALVLKIMRGKYEPICVDYSHDLRIIVKDMLNKDMKKRLTLKKFFNRKCVIDKSKELNIQIPCIEDKGKEYLKYMNVNKCSNDDVDIGNGTDHQNSKKSFALLNKGNNLTGNIRGGRVRGRTQTRILAALPTELINNSNNKSPPLKRVKNDEVQKDKAQRRKCKYCFSPFS